MHASLLTGSTEAAWSGCISQEGNTTSSLKAKRARCRNLALTTSICLIVLVGAALRFYDLGRESYWFDEVYTVHMAQEGLDQLLAVKELDWPPVYYVLIHYWVRLFGTAETATRSFSAVAGVAATTLTYLVGRELFGKSVGLLSALLMAMSEFQIYYSQETRFYSLFLLATLVSFLFFIRALRTNRTSQFLLYAASSVLVFYCGAFGIFVLAAQNLHFLLRWTKYRETRAKFLLCQGAILLAIAPNLIPNILEAKLIVGAGAPRMGWIPDPSVWAPLRTVYQYVFPLRHGRSWSAVGVNFGVGMAFLVIGVLVFAVGDRRERWIASVRNVLSNKRLLTNNADELLLVGSWFLCPIALPFVLSKMVGPMYVDRYTISAAPGFYLLLAFGITSVRRLVPIIVSLTTLVVLIVPGLGNYYIADVKEQWREVAAYVEANTGDGDVVVFAPDEAGWQQRSFDWYYQGSVPSCGMSSAVGGTEAISSAAAACTAGHERIWLVMRGTATSVERFKQFFLEDNQNSMDLIREEQFTGISVYLFRPADQ